MTNKCQRKHSIHFVIIWCRQQPFSTVPTEWWFSGFKWCKWLKRHTGIQVYLFTFWTYRENHLMNIMLVKAKNEAHEKQIHRLALLTTNRKFQFKQFVNVVRKSGKQVYNRLFIAINGNCIWKCSVKNAFANENKHRPFYNCIYVFWYFARAKLIASCSM